MYLVYGNISCGDELFRAIEEDGPLQYEWVVIKYTEMELKLLVRTFIRGESQMQEQHSVPESKYKNPDHIEPKSYTAGTLSPRAWMSR
jgi:hypothetical protein